MEDKLSIEDTLVLSTTASWVSAPALLLLHHNGRSFEARVDPSALPPGLHYAEIHATDASATWRGPVVRIPVTVIKPQQLPEEPDLSSAGGALPPLQMSADAGPAAASAGQQADAAGAGSGEGLLPPHTLRLGPLALSAGQEQRHFIAVPPGATWGELVIRAGAYDTPKTFLIR
jgi:tripeptidyl-peptidase-2